MAKSTKSDKKFLDPFLDTLQTIEQAELWDINDPSDRTFWEEFFRIEELLSVTDDFDPPSFSITIQNDQTGEVKTYRRVRLKSVRNKVVC